MAVLLDTDIPYGNACDIEIVEKDDRSLVLFSADPHGGPCSLWFCFRLRAEGDGPAKVSLRFRNPDTTLGGGRAEGLRPVIRPDGGDWERLPRGRREDLPDGRYHIAWDIERPASFADVALCYPYGPNELDALVDETAPAFNVDHIGVSQAGRPIVRLSNDYGEPEGERPGLYLLARQHSGETPGSWVLDGFLRKVAELGDAAPLVWAVPLTNIDGIVQGDYGKDNYPYDLNRAWSIPAMRHETNAMMGDVNRWKARCAPALAIDFHAPGGSEDRGAYAFIPGVTHGYSAEARARVWAELLGKAAGEYGDMPFPRVATYRSRWETPNEGDYFRTVHEVPALCIETPYALSGEVVFTRERYRDFGTRLATAVTEELRR